MLQLSGRRRWNLMGLLAVVLLMELRLAQGQQFRNSMWRRQTRQTHAPQRFSSHPWSTGRTAHRTARTQHPINTAGNIQRRFFTPIRSVHQPSNVQIQSSLQQAVGNPVSQRSHATAHRRPLDHSTRIRQHQRKQPIVRSNPHTPRVKVNHRRPQKVLQKTSHVASQTIQNINVPEVRKTPVVVNTKTHHQAAQQIPAVVTHDQTAHAPAKVNIVPQRQLTAQVNVVPQKQVIAPAAPVVPVVPVATHQQVHVVPNVYQHPMIAPGHFGHHAAMGVQSFGGYPMMAPHPMMGGYPYMGGPGMFHGRGMMGFPMDEDMRQEMMFGDTTDPPDQPTFNGKGKKAKQSAPPATDPTPIVNTKVTKSKISQTATGLHAMLSKALEGFLSQQSLGLAANKLPATVVKTDVKAEIKGKPLNAIVHDIPKVGVAGKGKLDVEASVKKTAVVDAAPIKVVHVAEPVVAKHKVSVKSAGKKIAQLKHTEVQPVVKTKITSKTKIEGPKAEKEATVSKVAVLGKGPK